MKQIEGQLSIFDFISQPKPEPQYALPCDTCGYDIKGCCDYDYIKNHDYCVLGSKWTPKRVPPIDRYLRYGPHTLIPEVRDEVKAYLEQNGVPDWVKWDKNSLPCVNCTWYDGSVCKGGGHTCHYEFGYLICDGFYQSIVERKPSTVGDAFPSMTKTKYEPVTMFGKEWHPLDDKPEDITEYDQLEILGTYTWDNKEKWSCCPACLEKGQIIALDVPWDIPRPKWKYWRLKEKVYPVDIMGICDDAYCPKCGRELDDLRIKDCERCPDCHVRIDWTPWHRANDTEEEQ